MTAPHGILKRLLSEGAGARIPDPGDAGSILVDRQFAICEIDSAGAETRTLPVPTLAGQYLTLSMTDDDGAVTLTVTGGYNQDGDTTMVFNDVFDVAFFISVYDKDNDAFEWRLLNPGSGGVTGQGDIKVDTISEETAAAGVQVDGLLIQDGKAHTAQGAPAAETGAATISIADILTGIVTLTQSTGATVALTLDTGTAMDAGMPGGFAIGDSIDWSIINLSAAAADTGTLTAAADHTIVGTAIIQSAHASTGLLYGNSVMFRSRRTAATTWVTYRLAG